MTSPELPDPEALFSRLAGGDPRAFFREDWRRRPRIATGAGATLEVPIFLELLRSGAVPWRLAPPGGPGPALPRRTLPLDDALVEVAAGGALVADLGALAADDAPEALRPWLRAEGALRRWLGPECVPDGARRVVTGFYGVAGSSVGAHQDNGDVLSFGLDGWKRWRVATRPDPSGGLRRLREGRLQDRGEMDLESTAHRVGPGDVLYVPAWAEHEVRCEGPALAISIGLPPTTEVHLAAVRTTRLLNDLQRATPPLPGWPRTLGAPPAEVAEETAKRLGELAGRVAAAVRGEPT